MMRKVRKAHKMRSNSCTARGEPMDEDKIYTKDVAKQLGVTPTTVRSYYKNSDFPDPKREKRGKQTLYYLTPDLLKQYKNILKI